MPPRTILITGANRGIDFLVLQASATRSPSDHYLLAARSTKNGVLAIQELRKSGVQAEINVVEFDVATDSSIKRAEQEVRKKHRRPDILVNRGCPFGLGWIPNGAGTMVSQWLLFLPKTRTARTSKKATLRPLIPTLPVSHS